MMKKIRMLYFRLFRPHIYRYLKQGEAIQKGFADGIRNGAASQSLKDIMDNLIKEKGDEEKA